MGAVVTSSACLDVMPPTINWEGYETADASLITTLFANSTLRDADDSSNRSTTPPPVDLFDNLLPELPDAYDCPPYTPREHFAPEPLELVHVIDPTALIYATHVDENLYCSICRSPFSDPRITECGHVFCKSCLLEAVSNNGNQCPTDRKPFKGEKPHFQIIWSLRNQVDALLVECPTCKTAIQRSEVRRHLSTECPEARMACPGKYTDPCDHHILRKDLTASCLHFMMQCEECFEKIPAISMKKHLDEECPQLIRTCSECHIRYARKDTSKHEDGCEVKMTPCRWSMAGCQNIDRRMVLAAHEETCTFRFLGQLFNEMQTLRTSSERERKEDAIQRLELEKKVRDMETRMEALNRKSFTDLVKYSPLDTDLGLATLHPGLEEVATQLDEQRVRMDKLEAGLKETEARSTTLVFNENLAIQNELIELRSLQQTTSMHVRWLLQFRLQENRRNRFAAGGIGGNGGGGPDSGGASDSGAPIVPRRSSDSLHEPPRL